MSKCQMRKFAPGGRCGGSSGEKSGCNPEMNAALSSLLAARTQQDACWKAPVEQKLPPLTQSTQLVVKQEVVKPISNTQKKIDIDCILGDF